VQLNGQRVKPARDVKAGDELAIHIGALEWVIEVRGISARRGPAEEAQQLYAERADSRSRRQAILETRKRVPEPALGLRGRPTKRDRRRLNRFTGG
jgi:ribosome-associated heat shock protein Hsp15